MERREEIIQFLQDLQRTIIASFETLEQSATFSLTPWRHHTGGGGTMAVIRGEVFEKAAVNFSAVEGPSFPMQDGQGPFFATGVSLITHMSNPKMPTVHMNVRYIETREHHWFGGGYDLTPMGFPFEEDTTHFHAVAKQALDPFSPHLYPSFYQNAKEYFFIPHRKKERGVGGIFFDHYSTGDYTQDEKMWQSVAHSFLLAIMPIYEKRKTTPYTDADKLLQLEKRAHYVEFNLIYDRGTKFGFLSGGNPEAILCSMPPMAKW